ncbi:hypothetical protein Tco_0490526 [Tanacetum coccineum]
MSSSHKLLPKPSRVAKISVRPVWRKKLNTSNTSNVDDVNLPTQISKPQSPINQPSQENSPTTKKTMILYNLTHFHLVILATLMFVRNTKFLEKSRSLHGYRERDASAVTNARQGKGKLHDIISPTSLTSQEKQLDREEFQETESIGAFRSKEGKVDSSKALDDGLAVTKSTETESVRHISSSRSMKDTHAEDADINFMNDKHPLAEVQLTVQHNTLANEQQHSVQFEPIYDTHLLEKVDRNTIPDSTNMCH